MSGVFRLWLNGEAWLTSNAPTKIILIAQLLLLACRLTKTDNPHRRYSDVGYYDYETVRITEYRRLQCLGLVVLELDVHGRNELVE